MGKGKDKIKPASMVDFRLPEPLIQHLQSFLTAKQAAQTTTLSKSWRKAWLTRPNLDFDENDFQSFYIFSGFAKKVIQRYEKLNLKIESLRLFMKRTSLQKDRDFASTLIVKALKFGATHISFRLNYRKFVLPHEVFGAQNLVGLSVEGCTIALGPDQILRCSRLKSLSLSNVKIEGNLIPNTIILCCPLLEQLSLSHIRNLSDCNDVFGAEKLVGEGCKIDLGLDRMVSCWNLKSISLSNVKTTTCLIHEIISSSPMIEELSLSWIYALEDGPFNFRKFHKLRCLVLCNAEIDFLFHSDLSERFPSLKDLTLKSCSLGQDILISSRSLERLNFAHHNNIRVVLDVPSICKFTFEGSIIPSVSCKSTSFEWESHISIKPCHLHTLSFHKLNKFLLELSPSKIYLSLYDDLNKIFGCDVREIQGLPKPEVENLIMETNRVRSLTCYAREGLFKLCRPKFVTLSLLPMLSSGDGFLCNTPVQGTNEKRASLSHGMYGLRDLEEINVQLFDEVVALWRDLPWNTFLDAPMILKDKQKMRFRLRWKS